MLFSSVVSTSVIFGTINAMSLLIDLFVVIMNFTIGWSSIGEKTAAAVIHTYIRRISVISRYNAEREALDKPSEEVYNERVE